MNIIIISMVIVDSKLMENGMYFISLYKGNQLLKIERLLKVQ